MKKICFLFLIGMLMLTGCSVKKTNELTDAEKFSREYGVSKDNPFKYLTIDETIDMLEHGSGIIFLGNSDCEWCTASAKILTKALKEKNVDQAYYYNPKKIRDKNTKKYKKLVSLLGDNLEKDEEDKPYLFIPDIYVVKDGKIIEHNNDLATMDGTVDDALTKERKQETKKKYLKLITKYVIKDCTSC